MKAGIDSPVGPLTVFAEDGMVTELLWQRCVVSDDAPVLRDAIAQLLAYFAGELTQFNVPMRPKASNFQRQFNAALCAIPYGETRTYGDLSKDLGVSAQAIGQACGANTIPVIIPCHRVLAANGLGGYSGMGGVETKVALLRLEGAAGLLI